MCAFGIEQTIVIVRVTVGCSLWVTVIVSFSWFKFKVGPFLGRHRQIFWDPGEQAGLLKIKKI